MSFITDIAHWVSGYVQDKAKPNAPPYLDSRPTTLAPPIPETTPMPYSGINATAGVSGTPQLPSSSPNVMPYSGYRGMGEAADKVEPQYGFYNSIQLFKISSETKQYAPEEIKAIVPIVDPDLKDGDRLLYSYVKHEFTNKESEDMVPVYRDSKGNYLPVEEPNESHIPVYWDENATRYFYDVYANMRDQWKPRPEPYSEENLTGESLTRLRMGSQGDNPNFPNKTFYIMPNRVKYEELIGLQKQLSIELDQDKQIGIDRQIQTLLQENAIPYTPAEYDWLMKYGRILSEKEQAPIEIIGAHAGEEGSPVTKGIRVVGTAMTAISKGELAKYGRAFISLLPSVIGSFNYVKEYRKANDGKFPSLKEIISINPTLNALREEAQPGTTENMLAYVNDKIASNPNMTAGDVEKAYNTYYLEHPDIKYSWLSLIVGPETVTPLLNAIKDVFTRTKEYKTRKDPRAPKESLFYGEGTSILETLFDEEKVYETYNVVIDKSVARSNASHARLRKAGEIGDSNAMMQEHDEIIDRMKYEAENLPRNPYVSWTSMGDPKVQEQIYEALAQLEMQTLTVPNRAVIKDIVDRLSDPTVELIGTWLIDFANISNLIPLGKSLAEATNYLPETSGLSKYIKSLPNIESKDLDGVIKSMGKKAIGELMDKSFHVGYDYYKLGKFGLGNVPFTGEMASIKLSKDAIPIKTPALLKPLFEIDSAFKHATGTRGTRIYISSHNYSWGLFGKKPYVTVDDVNAASRIFGKYGDLISEAKLAGKTTSEIVDDMMVKIQTDPDMPASLATPRQVKALVEMASAIDPSGAMKWDDVMRTANKTVRETLLNKYIVELKKEYAPDYIKIRSNPSYSIEEVDALIKTADANIKKLATDKLGTKIEAQALASEVGHIFQGAFIDKHRAWTSSRFLDTSLVGKLAKNWTPQARKVLDSMSDVGAWVKTAYVNNWLFRSIQRFAMQQFQENSTSYILSHPDGTFAGIGDLITFNNYLKEAGVDPALHMAEVRYTFKQAFDLDMPEYLKQGSKPIGGLFKSFKKGMEARNNKWVLKQLDDGTYSKISDPSFSGIMGRSARRVGDFFGAWKDAGADVVSAFETSYRTKLTWRYYSANMAKVSANVMTRHMANMTTTLKNMGASDNAIATMRSHMTAAWQRANGNAEEFVRLMNVEGISKGNLTRSYGIPDEVISKLDPDDMYTFSTINEWFNTYADSIGKDLSEAQVDEFFVGVNKVMTTMVENQHNKEGVTGIAIFGDTPAGVPLSDEVSKALDALEQGKLTQNAAQRIIDNNSELFEKLEVDVNKPVSEMVVDVQPMSDFEIDRVEMSLLKRRTPTIDLILGQKPENSKDYEYRYWSFNRPMDKMWAKLKEDFQTSEDQRTVYSKTMLGMDEIIKYELIPEDANSKANLMMNYYEKRWGLDRGVVVHHRDEGKIYGAIISESVRQPGKWQGTYFDEKGFISDFTADTQERAFVRLAEDGFWIPKEPTFIDRVAKYWGRDKIADIGFPSIERFVDYKSPISILTELHDKVRPSKVTPKNWDDTLDALDIEQYPRDVRTALLMEQVEQARKSMREQYATVDINVSVSERMLAKFVDMNKLTPSQRSRSIVEMLQANKEEYSKAGDAASYQSSEFHANVYKVSDGGNPKYAAQLNEFDSLLGAAHSYYAGSSGFLYMVQPGYTVKAELAKLDPSSINQSALHVAWEDVKELETRSYRWLADTKEQANKSIAEGRSVYVPSLGEKVTGMYSFDNLKFDPITGELKSVEFVLPDGSVKVMSEIENQRDFIQFKYMSKIETAGDANRPITYLDNMVTASEPFVVIPEGVQRPPITSSIPTDITANKAFFNMYLESEKYGAFPLSHWLNQILAGDLRKLGKTVNELSAKETVTLLDKLIDDSNAKGATYHADAIAEIRHRIAYQDEYARSLTDPNVIKPPPLKLSQLPEDLRTWLLSNTQTAAKYELYMDLLEQWKENAKTQLGSDAPLKEVSTLGGDVSSSLSAEVKEAARSMAEVHDKSMYGGNVDGWELEGAIPHMNIIMKDYATSTTNFDQMMKNFYWFWMFPTRGAMSWTRMAIDKPEILSYYNKYLRYSRMSAYNEGAINSKGDPLPSKIGYTPMKMLGSDVWINPTGGFPVLNFIFAPRAEAMYMEEDNGQDPVWYTIDKTLNQMSLRGFRLGPSMEMLLLLLRDSTSEEDYKNPYTGRGGLETAGSLVAELLPIPKPLQDALIGFIFRKMGNPSIPEIWNPQVSWMDWLVSVQIQKDLLPKLQAASSEDEKWEIVAPYVKIDRAQQGDTVNYGVYTNPEVDYEASEIWKRAKIKVQESAMGAQMWGFTTSFYPKYFSSDDLLLNQIRNEKNFLGDMVNDELGASVFLPDLDQQQRSALYSDSRYEAPESWIFSLRNATGYVKDPITGLEIKNSDLRRKETASILTEQIVTAEYYDQKQANSKVRDDKLRAVPISSRGSSDPISQAAWAEYWEKDMAIENDPQFAQANKPYMVGYKPTDKIYEDFRNMFWHKLEETMPVRDYENDEKYADFQVRLKQWEKDKPIIAQGLYPIIALNISRSIDTAYADEGQDFSQIIPNLQKEVEDENGQELWHADTDYILEAIANVYDKMYMQGYYEAVADLGPNQRREAHTNYVKTHPVPQIEQILEGVQTMYPNRWTNNQIMEMMTEPKKDGGEERQVLGVDETQEVGQEPSEDLYQSMQDMWSWIPPNQRSEFRAEFEALGGDKDSINLLFEVVDPKYLKGMRSFQGEGLASFVDTIAKTIDKMGLTEPTGGEVAVRADAERKNEDFEAMVAQQFGETFLEDVYYAYLDLSPAGRKLFKKEQPDDYANINQYHKLRDQFAKNNPIWAEYYYADYTGKKTGYYGGGGYSRRGGSSGRGYVQRGDEFVGMGMRGTQDVRELLGGKPLGSGGAPKWLPPKTSPVLVAKIGNKQKLNKRDIQYLKKLRESYPEIQAQIDEVLQEQEVEATVT